MNVRVCISRRSAIYAFNGQYWVSRGGSLGRIRTNKEFSNECAVQDKAVNERNLKNRLALRRNRSKVASVCQKD